MKKVASSENQSCSKDAKSGVPAESRLATKRSRVLSQQVVMYQNKDKCGSIVSTVKLFLLYNDTGPIFANVANIKTDRLKCYS